MPRWRLVDAAREEHADCVSREVYSSSEEGEEDAVADAVYDQRHGRTLERAIAAARAVARAMLLKERQKQQQHGHHSGGNGIGEPLLKPMTALDEWKFRPSELAALCAARKMTEEEIARELAVGSAEAPAKRNREVGFFGRGGGNRGVNRGGEGEGEDEVGGKVGGGGSRAGGRGRGRGGDELRDAARSAKASKVGSSRLRKASGGARRQSSTSVDSTLSSLYDDSEVFPSEVDGDAEDGIEERVSGEGRASGGGDPPVQERPACKQANRFPAHPPLPTSLSTRAIHDHPSTTCFPHLQRHFSLRTDLSTAGAARRRRRDGARGLLRRAGRIDG